MATTAEQVRSYPGSAILSYGFRPFFLVGAIWSALVVAIWLPMLAVSLSLPIALSPVEWHVHELLYGYLPAIAAGFLLTAVPNWTGRLPVTGAPLLGLLLVWAAGRVAMLVSGLIDAPAAAMIDLLFLAVLASVIAREIVRGHSTQNLKVLALIGLLFVGNLVFHLETMQVIGPNGYGTRIGIGAAILLITVVGGRIVPSFTRNWLARRPPGPMPTPFNRFDMMAIAAGAAAIAAWIVAPSHRSTAILAIIAGLLHATRLARWAGYRTLREPLVLVLHVGYAFVPVGFLLLTLAIVAPQLVVPSGALHGWTVGAIGTMTLAVMTRATLGHTGQALVASPSTQFIYAAIVIAAAARVLAAFNVWHDAALAVAAASWVLAFGGFAISFGPLLSKPRPHA